MRHPDDSRWTIGLALAAPLILAAVVLSVVSPARTAQGRSAGAAMLVPAEPRPHAGKAAAARTTAAAPVVVAVLDTGVDAAQADLAGAVLPGWNFVAGNADTADDNEHGTTVADLIAGRCPTCKILPVKVLGADNSGSNSTIAEGVVWAADHGAKIINLSLAGPTPNGALQAALGYAAGRGAFVAIAAGNAGSSDPAAGGYPAYYAKDTAGVISVGAADHSQRLYSFSNFGAWVEIAAPGCAVAPAAGGGTTTACGTSIAAPWVAGSAALALSRDPSLTPAQLEQLLEASADHAAPAVRVTSDGVGVPCDGVCTGSGLLDDQAFLQATTPG